MKQGRAELAACSILATSITRSCRYQDRTEIVRNQTEKQTQPFLFRVPCRLLISFPYLPLPFLPFLTMRQRPICCIPRTLRKHVYGNKEAPTTQPPCFLVSVKKIISKQRKEK